MKHLIFILFFIPIVLKAQEPRPVNLSATLEKGVVTTLANNWKYKVGDHPDWANPAFDDSSWQTFTNPNLFNKKIQKKAKSTNIIWYRKRISIDSTTTQKVVAYIYQSGASEIYLDGKLIHSLGKVSSNPDSIVCYNPASVQLAFPMKINKVQVLAVRFTDKKKNLSLFQDNTGLLTIQVQREDYANEHLFVANDSSFDANGFISLTRRSGWRFHSGDDLNWSNPGFDDSNWIYKPAEMLEPIPDSLWQGYCWFRYRFAADSLVNAKVTNLYFSTRGAAEVYLDGKLVKKFGVFSTNLKGERRYNSFNKTSPAIVLQPAESHVLAVRYSYHKGQKYKKLLGQYAGTFGFDMGLGSDKMNQQIISSVNRSWQFVYILGTMLFLIVLLHSFLFLLFPTERSNLYIAIVAFLLLIHIIITYLDMFYELDVLEIMLFINIPYIVLFAAALSMFPFTISSMFNMRPRLTHKILIWLFPVFALANFILSGPYISIIVVVVLASVVLLFSSQVLIQAWRDKKKGVWIVAGAFFGLIISTVTFIFYSRFSQNYRDLFGLGLTYLIYGSIPLGLTAFMASRFRDLYTHLEQKVKERTHELNQSLDELRSTQKQLIQSEKMASLGELTAGIAHEIQNPLNFVNNFSEVNSELIQEIKDEIEKGNLKEVKALVNDIADNEQKINHHGKRAEAIVKGMLQHSRTSNGVKEPTNINALADEYLRLAYHGLRAKDKSFNAAMKTDFDETIGKITIIPQDIGRVILNLITNAFYAVNEKKKQLAKDMLGFENRTDLNGYEPTVSVSTKRCNGKLEISVKDNGNGIPQKALDKIFQPFFTTKPTGQGTGLGLSISYDIIKAHGGDLKVLTKEGQGCEFIIHLPLN